MKKLLLIVLAVVCFLPLNFVGAKADETYKSKSQYLYDFNTKTELYAHNENERLQIASMTKIMLLNLCFEKVSSGELSLDEDIVVSKTASGMGGSQVFLEEGGIYKAGELIKSIVVASANDASVAIAERLYGSEENCVKEMNNKALKMGLKNTLFCNVTGLPKPMQYCSAKDITLIFADLISHKEYFNYSTVWLDKIDHKKNSTEISNTNKLVKFYEGCDGGKTGFTSEAGFCLTATAKRGNMRVISCVIGAPDGKTRFNESSKLLNYAFNCYENKAIFDKTIPLEQKIAVYGGKVKEIECVPENDFFVLCKRGERPNVSIEYSFNKVSAPVSVSDKLGTASVYVNGVLSGEINLISNVYLERNGYFGFVQEILKNWAI